MIISVASNVLSTIYLIIFDLLLNILLSQLITSILVKINDHHISRASGLKLSLSRLDKVVKYGFTTKVFSRISCIVGIIVLTLSILGSFSIEGRSRPKFTPISAPQVTVLANSPSSYVDYTKHISPDGSRVSATFLLAAESAQCFSTSERKVTHYSAKNSFSDLNSLLFFSLTDPNSTCITKETGHKEMILYSAKRAVRSRAEISPCRFVYFFPDEIVREKVHSMNISSFNCAAELVSAVAAYYQRYSVIIQLKYSEGFILLTAEFRVDPYIRQRSGEVTMAYVSNTLYDEKVLRSIAYMHAVNQPFDSHTTTVIARTAVKIDGLVMRRDGDLKESVVNIKWFIVTAGVAVSIVIITGMARVLIGFIIIGKPRENGLNSALSCIQGAQKVAGEDINQSLWIGFRREDWSVGPIGEMDLTEGMKGEWNVVEEQTLQGRLGRNQL